MKYLFTLFFLVLLSPIYAADSDLHKTIIIGSYLVPQDALNQKNEFEAWAKSSERITSLQAEYNLHFVTRKSGPYLVVALEPIPSEAVANELFSLIKTTYHDAFITRIRSRELLALYAQDGYPESVPPSQSVPKEPSTQPQEQGAEQTASASKEAAVATEAPSQSVPTEPSTQPQEQDTEQTVSAPKEVAVATKASSEPAAATVGMPSLTTLLLSVLVTVLLTVIGFLLRHQRNLKQQLKRVEARLVAANSSNVELNSANLEYKDSIVEQEGLIVGISGKLKDPAKEILGKAEKISDTDLSDKQSIELRNIQESGQVLFAIVDDLLDFMKIRSNKLKIEVKPFDINELLDLIVRAVLERIEKKDVEVVFDIEKNVPPHIIGDPLRIGQVLTNLLENGIKFTNAGEVKLHVKTLSKKGSEIQLMFEVIDTGIGISESQLVDIFSPFYQISNNNSAGLGLAISKALVEMMGGEILVSTGLNKGSTFTFVLSLQELDAEEKRHYHMPEKAYKRRRILILDYHDNAAKAMKKLLEYFHNDVDIFTQSEMASLAPDLSSYDMLFISEQLLTFELVKQIGALKQNSDTKVVIVGSMLHHSSKANVVEKLADGRIMKPVNQQNIFDLFVNFYGDEVIEPLQVPADEIKASASMPRIVIERTQKEDITKDDFAVFRGARLLVAEDNIINQKVISSLLKTSGVDVDMAEDGATAFEMAKSIEYDLILMDVNMPVMNGYEATERLKSSPKTAFIPVVALSGNTMPDEIAEMKRCGMDDRLEKPIKVPELFTVFSKYLKSHPVAQEVVVESIPDQFYQYEDGLERCGGDVALYGELVDEFMKLYSDSDITMERLYHENKVEALRKLSLDIKGVSANIGAYALAVAAKKVNQASVSSSSMPKLIESYKKTLNQTVELLASQSEKV